MKNVLMGIAGLVVAFSANTAFAACEVGPCLPGGLHNGGFEAPAMPFRGYQYNPGGGNWSFVGGSGIQSNYSAWSAAPAQEGRQTAFLQGNALISQTVYFDAGTYRVSFYAARRGSQIQPLQLAVDGVPFGQPITPTSTSFGLYYSNTFTVTAADYHMLQFRTTNFNGDNSSFVDAVTIEPTVCEVGPCFYVAR